MVIYETETPGAYMFTATSMDKLEPGMLILFDVEYTDGGVVSSSETFCATVGGGHNTWLI